MTHGTFRTYYIGTNDEQSNTIPGRPLLPYGLCGLEWVLPGLGTLLIGEFGLGLRWEWLPGPPFVNPPAE